MAQFLLVINKYYSYSTYLQKSQQAAVWKRGWGRISTGSTHFPSLWPWFSKALNHMFNFRRMSNPISAEQSVCFVLIDFNGATHRPVKSCVLCVTLSQLLPPRSALQHGLWSESLQMPEPPLLCDPGSPTTLFHLTVFLELYLACGKTDCE